MDITISLERQERFRAGDFNHFLLPDFYEPGICRLEDPDGNSLGKAELELIQDKVTRDIDPDRRREIAKLCGFTAGGMNKSIRSTHFGWRWTEGERYMRLFKAAFILDEEKNLMADSPTDQTPLQESIANIEVPFYLRLQFYKAQVEAVKIYKKGGNQLIDVTFGLLVNPADITDPVLRDSLFVPNETGGLQVPDIASVKPRDNKTKAWMLHVERIEPSSVDAETVYFKITNFYPALLKFKGMEPYGGDLPCAKFIITAQGMNGGLSAEQWFNHLYRLEFERKAEKKGPADAPAPNDKQTQLTDFTG